jgi:hypothetical protein
VGRSGHDLEQTPDLPFERRAHALRKRPPGLERRLRVAERGLVERLREAAEDLLLVAEVQVEGGPRHPGRAGDVLHGGAPEAVAGELLQGRGEDALAPRVGGGRHA